ncbi:MAG: AAA family ATPase, partial [Desulfurococcaceae archaeon]
MLKRIELRNIGPFEFCEVNFTSGINVLLGPNGSGKTSLLNAIFCGLQGHRLPSLLNIDSLQGSILLELLLNSSDPLTVYKKFNRNSRARASLTVRFQGRTIHRVKDLRQTLIDAFGITGLTPIYQRQGELMGFLNTLLALELNRQSFRSAVRKFVAGLLHLDELEQCISVLQTFPDSKSVIEKLNLIHLELKRKEEEYGNITTSCSNSDVAVLESRRNELERSLGEIRGVLINAKAIQKQFELVKDLQAKKEQLQRLESELQQITQRLEAVNSLLINIFGGIFTHKSKLHHYIEQKRHHLNVLQQRISLLPIIRKLKSEIIRLFLERPRLTHNISVLVHRQSFLKALLIFRNKYLASKECPVCLSPLASSLERLQKHTKELEQEVESIERILIPLQEQSKTYSQYRKAVSGKIRELRSYLEQLQDLNLFEILPLSAFISTVEEFLAAKDSLERKKEEYVIRIKETKDMINLKESLLATISKSFECHSNIDELQARELSIKRELDEINSRLQEAYRLESDKRRLEQDIAILKQRCNKVRKELEREHLFESLVKDFVDTIHEFCFEFLNDFLIREINQVLTESHANLSLVWTTSGLRAQLGSGSLVPISLLSYGQRLVIAFLLLL